MYRTTISKSISFENYKFKFQDNKYYNFFTASLYSKELIKEYPSEMNRTELGIYLELQGHYLFYLLGNSHAVDGADMRKASLKDDKDAYSFELAAKFIKVFKYFFSIDGIYILRSWFIK